MSGATGAVRKTLGTTIRSTQDIWFTKDPSSGETLLRLFPGAALHLVDHHLHASGILPRVFRPEAPQRIYEHDWFCVSQAVTCYPYEGLLELAVEDYDSTESLANTHIWVTKVGNSSLHLGQMITMDDQVLAAARRVFVRRQGDASAPFSEVEKYHFENECCADDYILGLEESLLRANEARAAPPPPPSLSSDGSPLPRLETFGTFLPKLEGKPILKTMIGPHHTNFGNHADHACLAEVALQALDLGTASRKPVVTLSSPPAASSHHTSIAINYISEAYLGQELNCYLHDDRVFVVRPVPNAPAKETDTAATTTPTPSTPGRTAKSTSSIGGTTKTPGRTNGGVANTDTSSSGTTASSTTSIKGTRQLILVAKLHR